MKRSLLLLLALSTLVTAACGDDEPGEGDGAAATGGANGGDTDGTGAQTSTGTGESTSDGSSTETVDDTGTGTSTATATDAESGTGTDGSTGDATGESTGTQTGDATGTGTDEATTSDCDEGFVLQGEACVDRDECDEGAPCGDHASCANTPGGFACTCLAGYAKEGTACVNVDECAAATSPCTGLATCRDTDGAYLCDCPEGLEPAAGGCEGLFGLADQGRNIYLLDRSGDHYPYRALRQIVAVNSAPSGPVVVGFNGLARHPVTGVYYALARLESPSFPHRHLVTLDLNSGLFTVVGDTQAAGHYLVSIAFSPEGVLYGITGTGNGGDDPNSLVTVDLTNGAVTVVGPVTGVSPGYGLAAVPGEGLYLAASTAVGRLSTSGAFSPLTLSSTTGLGYLSTVYAATWDPYLERLVVSGEALVAVGRSGAWRPLVPVADYDAARATGLAKLKGLAWATVSGPVGHLGDCNASLSADGFEVNLDTDGANCGGCAVECTVPNGRAVCSEGACTEAVASCEPNYSDVNGDGADGCEAGGGP